MITLSPRQAWRSLRRNRLAMFCLLLLAVMAAWCAGAALVAVER
jgi:peptide/nickel transport system permease protein